jgi:hypothetical protein
MTLFTVLTKNRERDIPNMSALLIAVAQLIEKMKPKPRDMHL